MPWQVRATSKFTIRPPWITLGPVCPTDAWSNWDLGKFGCQFNTPRSLSRSSVHSHAVMVCYECRRHKWVYLYLAVFGLVVCVMQHWHERQDPKFHSRALHYNKMIIVTDCTCQRFYFCGWRVHTCFALNDDRRQEMYLFRPPSKADLKMFVDARVRSASP